MRETTIGSDPVTRACLARDAVLICCSPRSVVDATCRFPGQRVLYVGAEPITAPGVISFRDLDALSAAFTRVTWRSPNVLVLDGTKADRERITSMILTTAANRVAAIDRGRDWVRNLIANLPLLAQYAPATAARDALRGCPALLVGPGPSLDINRAEIERFRGRALIVGCNSATRAVQCDVAVCVESHDLRHKLDPFAPIACLALTSPPAVVEHMTGVIAPVANGELGRIVAELTGTPVVPSSATVSTSALSLLKFWGCDPIVLVGHDLALGEGKRNYADVAGGGITPDSETFEVDGWGGGRVLSTRAYGSVRDFFSTRGGPGRINATEGGSSIPGWAEERLAQVWFPHVTKPAELLEPALRYGPVVSGDRLRAWVADQIDRLEFLARVAIATRGGYALAEALSYCPLLEPWVASDVVALAGQRWMTMVGDDEAGRAREDADRLAGILAHGAMELVDVLRSTNL